MITFAGRSAPLASAVITCMGEIQKVFLYFILSSISIDIYDGLCDIDDVEATFLMNKGRNEQIKELYLVVCYHE